MANADRPRGFAPYGAIKSANIYVAGSTVYPGEMVELNSDGMVDTSDAAGGALLGCSLAYATVGQDILVSDAREQRYVVQADETEIASQDLIGNVCDLVLTAGNSTYKAARQELDSSNAATTDGPLVIVGIERRPDNAFGANVDVIVMINENQLASDGTFAGV